MGPVHANNCEGESVGGRSRGDGRARDSRGDQKSDQKDWKSEASQLSADGVKTRRGASERCVGRPSYASDFQS